MFFGYPSQAEMRASNPAIADHLITTAARRETTVCTPGKSCTGSIDGKEFMYADGSTDRGITITSCTAKYHGHTFSWPHAS